MRIDFQRLRRGFGRAGAHQGRTDCEGSPTSPVNSLTSMFAQAAVPRYGWQGRRAQRAISRVIVDDAACRSE
jgi:hypothetical protein